MRMVKEAKGEEEKGIRITVTFPPKDAEWLQKQVESGEFTSLAEVVRMCVRTMRTGGPGVILRIGPGQEVIVPRDVALEAIATGMTSKLLSALRELMSKKEEGQ